MVEARKLERIFQRKMNPTVSILHSGLTEQPRKLSATRTRATDRSNDTTCPNLPETVHQRPMRAGCWRCLHANDDKVTACGFRNDVRSRKVVFRPTIWLFREFSLRIINMNGHPCMVDFCSQPEPVFIPFKQLLPHRFPFTRSEATCPVILAHLKSLFYIGFCRQKSKCPRIHCGGVHRGENHRRQHNDDRQQGGRAEKDLCERVHPKFLSRS